MTPPRPGHRARAHRPHGVTPSPGRCPASVVTLVRPPVVTLPGSLATHGPVPPIGLAYLAAVLRSVGHDVRVIDAPMAEVGHFDHIDSPIGPLRRTGLSPDEIVARIDPATRILGITNMFLHEWPQVCAPSPSWSASSCPSW